MYALILFIIYHVVGILSAMRKPSIIERYRPPGVGNHQLQSPAVLYPMPTGYNGGVIYMLNRNTGQTYPMQQIQNPNSVGFYQYENPIGGRNIAPNTLPRAS